MLFCVFGTTHILKFYAILRIRHEIVNESYKLMVYMFAHFERGRRDKDRRGETV